MSCAGLRRLNSCFLPVRGLRLRGGAWTCGKAYVDFVVLPDDIDLSPHVRQFLLTSIFERSQRKRSPPSTLLAKLQDLIEYEDSPESSSSATRRGVGVGGGASGSLGIPGSGPGAGPGTANGRPTLPGRPKSNSQQSIYGASPPTAAFLGNQRPGSFWQLRHPPSGSAQTPISGPSRYQSDFQEVEFLGKGAYGAVVKAQNRLDGRFYAIKKIRLSSTPAEDERTLREITALSRLNHPNIVRYVTCWIEESESPLEVERGMGTETGSGSELMTSSQSLKRRSSHAHEHGGGQMGEFGVGNAFGGMEDDFLSVGHNAFSQSASYPDIRFGYSDDGEDEEDDDDEDDEEKGKKNGSDSSSDSDSDSDSDSSEDSDWVGVSTARPRLRTLYVSRDSSPFMKACGLTVSHSPIRRA